LNLLDKIFNDNYFGIKKFERDGKIYENIGVKWFKKFLLNLAKKRRHERPFKNYFIKENSIDGLIDFEKRTRKSEMAHVIIVIVILAYQVRMIIFIDGVSDIIFLLFFTVLNIIANLYPICLQRYNRIRINRVIQKHIRYQSRS